MPLVVFVRQKTTNSGFYGYITMSFFPALVSMFTSAKESMWCSHGSPAMLNNPNPLLSMAEWRRYCSHLITLNLNHFKMAEAMGSRVTSRRLLQWHGLYKKYHEIYRSVKSYWGEGHTEAHTTGCTMCDASDNMRHTGVQCRSTHEK
jgi:hypothetical protein